jgi:hypothetical protein
MNRLLRPTVVVISCHAGEHVRKLGTGSARIIGPGNGSWGRELPVYGASAVDLLLGAVVVGAANHEGRGVSHLPALYTLTVTHLLAHLHRRNVLSYLLSLLQIFFLVSCSSDNSSFIFGRAELFNNDCS